MSNDWRTSIFLTGATGTTCSYILPPPPPCSRYLLGYIGGAVLARLLKHPKAGKFDITGLVRNAEKAKILESKFGVKTVVGTHQELDKIHDLAVQSHVVFHLVSYALYACLAEPTNERGSRRMRTMSPS